MITAFMRGRAHGVYSLGGVTDVVVSEKQSTHSTQRVKYRAERGQRSTNAIKGWKRTRELNWAATTFWGGTLLHDGLIILGTPIGAPTYVSNRLHDSPAPTRTLPRLPPSPLPRLHPTPSTQSTCRQLPPHIYTFPHHRRTITFHHGDRTPHPPIPLRSHYHPGPSQS
jgi:hypothetical protein